MFNVALLLRHIIDDLRDYGTAKWEGGVSDCDHKGKPMATRAGFNERYFGKPFIVDKQGEVLEFYKDTCGKCGAVRTDDQIGLEQTPDEYVAKMVSVFQEVKRVLKDDGTVWLNLGDSYSSFKDCKSVPDSLRVGGNSESANVIEKGKSVTRDTKLMKSAGLKNKDLIGIPWRVAFALQADGWYLRQDIIWHKLNPMPESVKDRCTKSHEYIFLLSKSARYYYDADAIKEMAVYGKDLGLLRSKKAINGKDPDAIIGDRKDIDSRNAGNGFRNKRSVWTVSTRPYKGAHFATFPPDLITPCVLAGCPEGGVVLDPFAGSGTTVMVANRYGRKGIGMDLSWTYLNENARKRIAEGK